MFERKITYQLHIIIIISKVATTANSTCLCVILYSNSRTRVKKTRLEMLA